MEKVFYWKLWLLLPVYVMLYLSCSAQNSKKNQDNMVYERIMSYQELHKSGELKKRGDSLWKRMELCDLCPRNCKINRLNGERGVCKANSDLEIASYGPHFGEEPELVGKNGSGTIFFTNCALLCVFCINSEISHGGYGRVYSIDNLANIMMQLQNEGRHNINLVSPSHYIPHILLAIDQAASKGLKIPIVYNTSGYEKKDVIEFLDGVVDIYLSDFKYGCEKQAGKYSIGAFDYVELAKEVHLEMQRQVGTAKLDANTGLMQSGLMIRHLVMPNNVSCSKAIMEWISENLPKDTYVNIMSQYSPVFNAKKFPEINRRITSREYEQVIEAARKVGLTNIRVQGN
jgi:putative pyruvate formate lyase activating enzyme